MLRIDSIVEVFEILVEGMGEEFNKNQWSFLSQSTPRTRRGWREHGRKS
jgi:hypothetical protein